MNISQLSIRRPVFDSAYPYHPAFGLSCRGYSSVDILIIFGYPAPTPGANAMLSKTRLPSHWSKTSMKNSRHVNVYKKAHLITVEFDSP